MGGLWSDQNTVEEGGEISDTKGLRKLLEKKYADPKKLEEEYANRTDLKCIEKLLFGNAMGIDEIPIRLYVTKKLPQGWIESAASKAAEYLQEVGSAHLAVQVADKIVHWVNTSYTITTEFRGSSAVALFYPQEGGIEKRFIENSEKNREALCRVICRWNCQIKYSSLKGNCQQFVAAIFKSFNLDTKFGSMEGAIGEFLRYLASANKEEIHPCIVTKGKKGIEWKTHKELDEWHEKNGESYDENLLKGFHRAFQLRGDHGRSCSFGDPTLLGEKPANDAPQASSGLNSGISSGINANSGQGKPFSGASAVDN